MGEALDRKRLPIMVGAVAVVVAVAVVLIVTTGGDEKQPAKAAPTSTTHPAPEPPPPMDPLPLADTAAWTSTGIGTVDGVDARDGVALYWGDGRVVLVDLASGATRWSLAKEAELPGGAGAQHFALYSAPRLVGHGDNLGVLVGYYWTDQKSQEVGIALLSAANGTVRWRAPNLTGSEFSKTVAQLRTTDDRMALVTVGDEVMALDLATGEERWRKPGFRPLEIAGNTVVGTTGPDVPTLPDKVREGSLVGHDLVTGEPRWDLTERYARSELVLTAGDVTLVRVAGEDGTRPAGVLVETATGREITKFGETAESCAGEETLIACQVNLEGGFGVTTFRLEGHQTEVSAAKLNRFAVETVWQGRIFVSNIGEWFTIDRAANRVDANLPGQLAAWTDGYALFLVRDGASAVVHCYVIGR